MGEKGEKIKKYKLVVTEQLWGCKVQHSKQSSQTHEHGQWYGDCLREWGEAKWRGTKGENWDNSNSIIKKIYLKKTRGVLRCTESPRTWIFDLPASRTVRNKCQLFKKVSCEKGDYGKIKYCWKGTTIFRQVGNIRKIVSSRGCLIHGLCSFPIWFGRQN